MLEIRKHKNSISRRYCIRAVSRVEEMPNVPGPVSKNYTWFLALDATSIDDRAILKPYGSSRIAPSQTTTSEKLARLGWLSLWGMKSGQQRCGST
jgi:hypothetical protein